MVHKCVPKFSFWARGLITLLLTSKFFTCLGFPIEQTQVFFFFGLAFKTPHVFAFFFSFPLNSLIHHLVSVIWIGTALDIRTFCFKYSSPVIIHLAKLFQISLPSECPQLELIPCFTLLHSSFLSILGISLGQPLCLHAIFLH